MGSRDGFLTNRQLYAIRMKNQRKKDTMKFKLEFDTDNAAFDDGGEHEVAQILKHAASQVLGIGGPSSGTLRDVNGNTVGSWTWR